MADLCTADAFVSAIKAVSLTNPVPRLEAALVNLRCAINEAEDRVADPARWAAEGAAAVTPAAEGAAAVTRALGLYALAVDLKARQTFVAWNCVQQIERELMHAATLEERQILWASYWKEAHEKLKNWRASAVEDISKFLRPLQATEAHGGDDTQGKPPLPTPSVAALQALMWHVHTASQNRQHKLDLIEGQIRILTLLLASVVGLALLLVHFGMFEWMVSEPATPLISVLPHGTLAGAFGALLSVAFKLSGADSTASIPDMRSLRWLTAARLAIGTAAAFPVLLFMSAGFMSIPGEAAKIYVALCVIAGFSERWFRETLESIANRSPVAGSGARAT